ncbi:hypothetical protein HDU81_001807 [Chytriomyces hyalinus]|nr:hypothetical protein HDU81_001807 [Chytriomyces hyalinus]
MDCEHQQQRHIPRMILTAEHFTLRAAEASDVSKLQTLLPTLSFLTSSTQASNAVFTIVVKDSDQVVGIAGINSCIDENGTATIASHLANEHNDTGYAQEIWNKLLQYFFEEVCLLGLVASTDELDQELLALLGFTSTGPDSAYTLTRDEWMRRTGSKFINTRTINTKNLLLRKYSPTDSDFIHSCLSNPQVMTYWSTLPHTNQSQTDAWLATVLTEGPNNVNGILDFIMHHKETNQAIGKIGIYQPLQKDGSGEVGYFLHPDFWGKRLMKEAMLGFLEHVFGEDAFGATVIKADVDPRNAASIRLLESVGFAETGKEERTLLVGEQWVDSVYLQLSREQFEAAK